MPEGEWYSNPDWWVAGFTGALFLATSGLWLATWKLWKATNKAVTDATRGLDIADKTLQHARDSSERELRAYIIQSSASLFWGGNIPENPHSINRNNQAAAVIVVKNEGKTPAYKASHWMKVNVASIAEESQMSIVRRSEDNGVPFVLAPNNTASADRWLLRDVTPEEAAGIIAGTHAIYVCGRIEYEDAFGKQRWTNYRLRYTHAAWPPLVKEPMSLNFCTEGNDAN